MNLKKLSTHLGLSQTTVSRALNGFPEVSEKTREKVINAAKDLGYAPSRAAQGLATGKVGAIGHVIPLGEHKMINPHFSDFIAGAGHSYAEAGLDVLMTVCKPEDELATYEKIAKSNRVDGFVLQGPPVDDQRIPLLNSLGIPFVVHGRSSKIEDEYSFLDVDNQAAFDRATQFLIDLGHRDIALLNGLETMDFAFRRRAGYEDAMKKAGLPLRPDLMFSQDMSEAYGHFITSESIVKPDRPTAFLCSSKLVAIGAMRAVAEAGLAPSKDISVVTFDDDFAFLGTKAAIPQVTCLRSSLFEAGIKVAEMIAKACDDPKLSQQELWQAEFVLGKSTGANNAETSL